MFEDQINYHDILFSGSSLKLGKIHWYILKADTEMHKRSLKPKNGFDHDEQTEFGKEVGFDEIHWWIYKKENLIEELYSKTENTLQYVQKLKEDSFSLKEKYLCLPYPDLIKNINEFTELHNEEIHALFDYVVWLNNRNVLAPIILFTYRIWGSTRLSDRTLEIYEENIVGDEEGVKKCTEIALGLLREKYVLEDIYFEIKYDIEESTDPESQRPIVVSKSHLLTLTSHKIHDELAEYFEFLRQSLRNILIEIDKYNAPKELLHSESWWEKFIRKSMEINRIEGQSWDFKQTFEMWETRSDKEKFNVKFCNQIASYANTTGGALIVGITDADPRRVKGLHDLESKVKYSKSLINRFINYDEDFTHFQQIIIDGDNCLIIAIAQTKKVIGVKQNDKSYSYPIREVTGLGYSDYSSIENSKRGIFKNNYDFILNLNKVLD